MIFTEQQRKEFEEVRTGVFTRTAFTAARSPKWLTPINNLAKLFGLMVTPIGKPVLLSKVMAEMKLKDKFKEDEEKTDST